jgi:hypothetical protein
MTALFRMFACLRSGVCRDDWQLFDRRPIHQRVSVPVAQLMAKGVPNAPSVRKSGFVTLKIA